jgi:hypothetical protein
MEKLYTMKQKRKVYAYEQIDFHELVKKYMDKQYSITGSVEGIYSVSLLTTKKGKGIFSSAEKEKIAERKENYLEVAIIEDTSNPDREYIEVPLDKKYLPSYSIRGEFTKMSEANILIYKHFEPRNKFTSYTFTYDRSKEILEGIRKENTNQFEYTYKLNYVKLHPKQLQSTRN